MSMEYRSLCRCTQLLQWFFLALVIKLLAIALVFKDVQALADLFMTWHFSSKNLLCQPRQTLRCQYNAVPMWLCQVSSIHIELCITSDLNNRFEVFFMDNEFDSGDGWLSILMAFFSDLILEYLIKSATYSFISYLSYKPPSSNYSLNMLIDWIPSKHHCQNFCVNEMVIEVIVLPQSYLFVV